MKKFTVEYCFQEQGFSLPVKAETPAQALEFADLACVNLIGKDSADALEVTIIVQQ